MNVNLFLINQVIAPAYTYLNFTTNLIECLEPNISIVEYGKEFQTKDTDMNVFFVLSERLFENGDFYSKIKGNKYLIEHDAYHNFLK